MDNIRKGKCDNYGECDKAGQEFSIEEGKPFECPECHSPLKALDGARKKRKKQGINPIVIVIAAIVVLAIVAGLYFALRTPEMSEEAQTEEVQTPSDTIVDGTESAVVPNRSDTLVIKVEDNSYIPDNDSLVMTPTETEVVESKTTDSNSKAKEVAKPKPKVQNNTSSATPASGSHKLSYGTWTGGWKNGQPHGTGTLTYSTSRTIDSRDPRGRVASPGEYVVGEWHNGHLVQGRWFKKDGTKEAIIIGKAG